MADRLQARQSRLRGGLLRTARKLVVFVAEFVAEFVVVAQLVVVAIVQFIAKFV